MLGVLWSDGNNRGPDRIPVRVSLVGSFQLRRTRGTRGGRPHPHPLLRLLSRCTDSSRAREGCAPLGLLRSHPQLALGLTLTTPPRRRTINRSSSLSSTSDPTPGQGR